MSGPVWRKTEGESETCDACLEEKSTVFVQGTVEDGEFRPRRALCEDCYDDHSARES